LRRTRTGSDMEGQNCNNICSWTHKPATDSKKKKEKEIPERVTLKKEIGLLSACTIIIGECCCLHSHDVKSAPPFCMKNKGLPNLEDLMFLMFY
uniref:Uncharacterized protein n=1 Tax=Poecilia latipinna TaxID=48699 RepID=A0A3B3VGG2_9TELE